MSLAGLRNAGKTTILLAALAAAACSNGKSEPNSSSGDIEMAPARDSAAAVRGGPIGMTDMKVLAWMDVANQGEVDAGKLAGERATSEQVKTFAKSLVQEHARMLRESQMLAKQLAKDPVADSASDAEPMKDLADAQSRAMSDIRAKTGTEFDKTFIDRMVDGHEHVLEKLKDWRGKALDPKLNTAMSRAIPVVEGHLTEAKRIQDTMKPKKAVDSTKVGKGERKHRRPSDTTET